MSKTKAGKPALPRLAPTDPRVTAAVLQRIREMPLNELQERLAHRSEDIVERQFPNPAPTSRRELLSRRSK